MRRRNPWSVIVGSQGMAFSTSPHAPPEKPLDIGPVAFAPSGLQEVWKRSCAPLTHFDIRAEYAYLRADSARDTEPIGLCACAIGFGAAFAESHRALSSSSRLTCSPNFLHAQMRWSVERVAGMG